METILLLASMLLGFLVFQGPTQTVYLDGPSYDFRNTLACATPEAAIAIAESFKEDPERGIRLAAMLKGMGVCNGAPIRGVRPRKIVYEDLWRRTFSVIEVEVVAAEVWDLNPPERYLKVVETLTFPLYLLASPQYRFTQAPP